MLPLLWMAMAVGLRIVDYFVWKAIVLVLAP